MFKFLIALVTTLLVGCGSSDVSAACSAPYEVAITRGWSGDIQQYRKATVNSPYVLHSSGSAALNAVLPCPGNTATQYLHFKTWSEGFFDSAHGLPPVGNHLAALTRSTIDLSVPQYLARGVILHTDFGVTAERYHRNDAIGAYNILQCPANFYGGSCPQGQFLPPHTVQASDSIFHWQMETTTTSVAYNVYSESTNQNAISNWAENYNHIPTTGTDIAFAVLCENTCATPFIVRFFDINAGWK